MVEKFNTFTTTDVLLSSSASHLKALLLHFASVVS